MLFIRSSLTKISRTGKLLQPKLGFLSILLNAYRDNACDDMIFVPVHIGYDRVPEESSYLHELGGGEKKPESFLQLLRAGKVLKKRYGRIYIQFDEPISMNDLLSDYGEKNGDFGENRMASMSSKEQNALCRNLGYRIVNAIDRVTVVSPHAIVAGAILNCSRPRFSYNYLMADIETYINYLHSRKATLADTLLVDYIRAVDYVFDLYIQQKFIERISPTDKSKRGKTGMKTDGNRPVPENVETLYRANVSRRPLLEYYKNNGITFFVPGAFTALAILEKDAFQFSISDLLPGYKFLQEFFINEFAYEVDRTPEYLVRKNIRAFIEDAMLMPHPSLADTFNLTSAGFRKLKLFSGFLRTYFESYRIVLNFFTRYPKNFIDSKDRMKKIQSMGNRMYKRKEIERAEALSRMSYKNAMDFFSTHGIKGSENSGKIEFYSDAIKKYMEHLPS